MLRPISLNTINYLPSGPTATIFAVLAQYYALIPHTYRYRISTTTSSSSSASASRNAPDSYNTNTSSSGSSSGSSASSASGSSKSLILLLSDKSTTYLVAAQLAFSQFPGMLLPAVVGWIVGLTWRAELLPGSGSGWRVPAWVLGEKERVSSRGGGGRGIGTYGVDNSHGHGEREGTERYHDLRRRLEGEAAAAAAASTSTSTGVGRRDGITSDQGQRQRRPGSFLERLRGAF